MVRYSVWLGAVLSAVASCAAVAQSASTTVQESKSDILLLSEIPQVVEQWTHRCTRSETAQLQDASRCWQAAATALARYTGGISENLTRQVEELQAAWLERAAQLEANEMDSPEADTPVARGALFEASAVVRISPLLRKAPIIEMERTIAPAKKPSQVRKVAAAKKLKPRKTAFKRVVKRVGRPQAAKNTQRRKIRVSAAAQQRPIVRSVRVQKDKATRRGIREELKKTEENLACRTLKCMIRKVRDN
jgi:hypothetical protein